MKGICFSVQDCFDFGLGQITTKNIVAFVLLAVVLAFTNLAHALKTGILKDRCSIRSGYPDEVPYWDVIDLIKFDDEESPWLRVGYYRMAKDTPFWQARQRSRTEWNVGRINGQGCERKAVVPQSVGESDGASKQP